MSTATRPSSSATTSVVLENPVSQSQPTERLVLRLNRKKKKVSWKEGTVDNEFMQKKSSKKCCIFHKQKPFDEDDSEEEEDNHQHHHDHDHDRNHEHSESGEASSSNDSKAVD
ncbi:PREDICTED: type 1 phosphatases regulator YPI2-like [Camelina sativa]|uniref:Type 1 phosphatases regulator YPI2-like n=1 Tax=Camelina sativa TaxID=90675 RepID=A0ABM0SPA1_CAMSA|nr:PREDICTED: type 1 phosphatases regulator YPI2-like [Camelina sativa]